MVRILRKVGLITFMTVCISYFLFAGLLGRPKYVGNTVEDQYTFVFVRENEQLNVLPPESSTKNVTVEHNKAQKNEAQKKAKLWEKQMSADDLISSLQKQRKNYQAMNRYEVKFQGTINQQHNPHDILCQIKHRVNISTLKTSELPESASSWSQYLPNQEIQEVVGKLKRCAVVASAASLKGSKLGEEIGEWNSPLNIHLRKVKKYVHLKPLTPGD